MTSMDLSPANATEVLHQIFMQIIRHVDNAPLCHAELTVLALTCEGI